MEFVSPFPNDQVRVLGGTSEEKNSARITPTDSREQELWNGLLRASLWGKSQAFSLSHPTVDSNSQRRASDWTDWVPGPLFGHGSEGQLERPSKIKGGISDRRKIHMKLREAREWVLGRQKHRCLLLESLQIGRQDYL